MADIATLGLQIDASGAVRAKDAVDRLAESGRRAEQAVQRVDRATRSYVGAAERAEQVARLNARAEAEWREAQARRAAEAQRRAAENGREQARAMAEALRRQLEFDEASIKAAVARGLLTPEEAREAARISAEAYNRELLSVIERGEATGIFRGAEGQAVFTEVAGGIQSVDEVSRRAGVGIGELRESMASLAAQAAGAHPVVGRLANVMGSFALGSATMVGVLGGMAALAFAWNKLTEDTRKAKEEAEEALGVIDRLREQRDLERLGPGAETIQAQITLIQELTRVTNELIRVQRLVDAAEAGGDPFGDDAARTARLRAQRDQLREEFDSLVEAIEDGHTAVGQARERAREDAEAAEARNLASLIAANRATESEQRRALEVLRGLREEFGALSGDDPQVTQQRAELLQQILALEAALGDLDTRAAATALTMDDLTRALEGLGAPSIARAIEDAIVDPFQKAIERNRRLREELRETIQAFKDAGGILTFVEPRSPRPGGDDGARDADIEAFNKATRAVREVTSGIRDMANALDELTPALAGVLRGIDSIAQGAGRIEAAQRQTGILGTLGTLSGGLSIGAGVLQLFSGLFGPDESDRRRAEMTAELERATEALRSFAESLREVSDLEARKAKAERELAAGTRGIFSDPGTFDKLGLGEQATGLVNEMLAAGATIEEISAAVRALGFGVPGEFDPAGLTAIIEEYAAALEAIEEARQREVASMKDDVAVRTLVAQGREEEADALRRDIQRRDEMARALALGDEELVAFLQTLYEIEDAAIETAKAAEEAARQFNIFLTDLDIDARRAALAGDDVEAFAARTRAQAEREKAALKDLLDKKLILPEQFEELSEIIDQETIAAIEEFTESLREAAQALMDTIEVEWLQLFGEPGEAAAFQVNQQFNQWMEQLSEWLEQGIITQEEFAEKREQAEQIRDRKLDDILAGLTSGGGALGRVADDRVRDEVVRRVAGISETSALSLVDLNRAQLTVLDRIAFNTDVLRAGDGVTNLGTRIRTSEPQQVTHTGDQYNIKVTIQGHVLNRQGVRPIVRDMIEEIEKQLGQSANLYNKQTGVATR